MRGLEASVPEVLEEARSAAEDDVVCHKLCPYLEAWPLILEGAGKIERAVLGALRRRVKINVDAAIEGLQGMYPLDYMTWILPGPMDQTGTSRKSSKICTRTRTTATSPRRRTRFSNWASLWS